MDSQSTEADVRLAAMDLLARREHPRVELAQKLEQRFARLRARAARRAARMAAQEAASDDAPLDDAALRDASMENAALHASMENAASPVAEDAGPFDLAESAPRDAPFETVVEAALTRLECEGLLSDTRFAEAYVRSRIARGQGPVRVRHELRGKGLDAAIIDLAMEGAEVDWQAHAEAVLMQRFGECPPSDVRDRARRMRFLQHRGFSFEVCHKLLN